MLLLNSTYFIDILKSFRKDIYNLTVKQECYYIVNRRIDYYDKKTAENDEYMRFTTLPSPPQEQCLEMVYRILFTARKPPYHYDFIIQYSPQLARKNVINFIKQRFKCLKKTSTRFKISISKCSSLHGQVRTIRGLSLRNRETNELSSRFCTVSPAHVSSVGNSTNRIYPYSFDS